MKFNLSNVLALVAAGLYYLPTVSAIQAQCSSHPDPHYTTLGGVSIDYHGGCDTVFVKNSALDLEVHLRTIAVPGFSFISAVGIKCGPDFLTIDTTTAGALSFTSLNGHPLSSTNPNPGSYVYQLTLPNGQYVRVTEWYDSLSIIVQADSSHFTNSEGMCGSIGVSAIVDRNGVPIPGGINAGQLWGDAWAVSNPLHGDTEFMVGGPITCGPAIPYTSPPSGCLCVDQGGVPLPDPAGLGCGPGGVGGDCDPLCFEAHAPGDHHGACVTQDQITAACADITDPVQQAECEFDVQMSGDTAWAKAPFYSGEPVVPLDDHRCLKQGDSRPCEEKGGRCVYECVTDDDFLCDTELCSSVESFLRAPTDTPCACKLPRDDTCPDDPGPVDPIKDPITFPDLQVDVPIVNPNELPCIDFDDGTANGFAPCPGHFDNIVVTPYPPSDDPTDPDSNPSGYVHLTDTAGSSLACGTGDAYTGNWNFVCDEGCHEFCFDFKVFYDGCTSKLVYLNQENCCFALRSCT